MTFFCQHISQKLQFRHNIRNWLINGSEAQNWTSKANSKYTLNLYHVTHDQVKYINGFLNAGHGQDFPPLLRQLVSELFTRQKLHLLTETCPTHTKTAFTIQSRLKIGADLIHEYIAEIYYISKKKKSQLFLNFFYSTLPFSFFFRERKTCTKLKKKIGFH